MARIQTPGILSFIAGGNVKWQYHGETVWQFPIRVNIHLPCDTAISLLRFYPRGMKMYVYTKICTWMFIATLCIIASHWKQSRCPSTGEWYSQTAIPPYNGILLNSKEECTIDAQIAWMDFSCIMLNDRYHIHNDYLCFGTTYVTFWKRQTYSGWQGLKGRGDTDDKKK